MNRSFPLLLVGIVGLTTSQIFAQGYGMGGGTTHPASQPSSQSPQNSASNNTASATSNANSKGPKTASVSISDGSHSATSFPTTTHQLSASFTTSGTNKGDKLQAIWVSTMNGRKKLYETSLTGDQANFAGSVSINGPASGWPAGKYELDLLVNNKLVAHQPFHMGK